MHLAWSSQSPGLFHSFHVRLCPEHLSKNWQRAGHPSRFPKSNSSQTYVAENGRRICTSYKFPGDAGVVFGEPSLSTTALGHADPPGGSALEGPLRTSHAVNTNAAAPQGKAGSLLQYHWGPRSRTVEEMHIY